MVERQIAALRVTGSNPVWRCLFTFHTFWKIYVYSRLLALWFAVVSLYTSLSIAKQAYGYIWKICTFLEGIKCLKSKKTCIKTYLAFTGPTFHEQLVWHPLKRLRRPSIRFETKLAGVHLVSIFKKLTVGVFLSMYNSAVCLSIKANKIIFEKAKKIRIIVSPIAIPIYSITSLPLVVWRIPFCKCKATVEVVFVGRI